MSHTLLLLTGRWQKAWKVWLCEPQRLNEAAVFFIRRPFSRVASIQHNLLSHLTAWMLSVSFMLQAGMLLHKQGHYSNMMKCWVFTFLYLWDAIIHWKSKLVIQLLDVHCAPCCVYRHLITSMLQYKKKKVLGDLVGACQNNTPFNTATMWKCLPHWLIFHRQNKRFAVWARWWITLKHIPYGKSGWCRRDGEASFNDKLPSLPVSQCSFLLFCCCCCWKKRVRGLFWQVEVISSSARHLEIPSGSHWVEQEFPSTMGNRGMQQTECLRWWFALSDLSIPVRCSKQAEVGWRPETSCPVGWLDGFQVESWGCFLTGCCAHPLSSCRLVRQGWGPWG